MPSSLKCSSFLCHPPALFTNSSVSVSESYKMFLQMFLSHLRFFFFFFSSHKCGTGICFSLLTARRVNFMWPLTPEKLQRNWSYKIKFLSVPCGNITNDGWHSRELLKHLFGVETGSLWRGSGNVWKQEATGRNCSVQTDLPPVQPVRNWRNTDNFQTVKGTLQDTPLKITSEQ